MKMFRYFLLNERQEVRHGRFAPNQQKIVILIIVSIKGGLNIVDIRGYEAFWAVIFF